jgi:hypothetical protein
VRQLGRVVGVEVHAVSIALSAFFAGLALGGALLGRTADRALRPVRLYAWLEGGVAALGVLSTLALARSAPLFVALQDTVGPLAWALPFGLVGLPAFLTGGTLPALLRSLHPNADAVAPATGVLYAGAQVMDVSWSGNPGSNRGHPSGLLCLFDKLDFSLLTETYCANSCSASSARRLDGVTSRFFAARTSRW